jgi:hypothetical protein
LKWFGVTGTLRSAIHGILTGGCAWLLAVRIWKSQDVIEVASVALLASFAITPYALQYDYPPLVIVMFWSLGMANQLQQKWMPVTLMCFIASVLLWERPISDGYWIVIGLSALTLWGIKGMQPVA